MLYVGFGSISGLVHLIARLHSVVKFLISNRVLRGASRHLAKGRTSEYAIRYEEFFTSLDQAERRAGL